METDEVTKKSDNIKQESEAVSNETMESVKTESLASGTSNNSSGIVWTLLTHCSL
jgi:hypothetical protein